MASPAEIVAHCTALPDREIERLVGWLAWRLGRNQALAGAGAPIARLEHAVTHWMGPERRALLLEWLRRRAAAGAGPVPG